MMAPVSPPPRRHRLVLRNEADSIVVAGSVADEVRVIGLLARRLGGEEVVELTQSGSPAFEFVIEVAALVHALPADTGRFDLFLSVETAQGPETWRLGRFTETLREEAMGPSGSGPAQAWTHVTAAGNVSILIADSPDLRCSTEATTLSTRGNRLLVETTVVTHNRPATAVRGLWLGRRSHSTSSFPVEITPLDPAAHHGLHRYRVRAAFDPEALVGDALDSVDDLCDPLLEVDLLDVDVPVRRTIAGPAKTPKLRDLTVRREESVLLLVPHFTQGGRLAFWSERFTASADRWRRRLRLVSWAFGPLRRFGGVWLIGELPDRAQDNGFHFFAWLSGHHPQQRAYYVIDADAPDLAKVAALGRVVTRHSARHLVLSQIASRLIGTHHTEYLLGSRSASVVRGSRGVRVFLQHGVTATKNVTQTYGRNQMRELPPDVFVVNSEAEQRIVVDHLGYRPEQTPITGFTRFDSLFADDVPPQRRVLVMPTWRGAVLRPELFETSEFFAAWGGVLRGPLPQAAARHGYEVDLVLHPNLRQYARHFDLPGVHLHPADADLQHLLKSSAVLVTDYSSVAWDFAFLDRPVVYFQFDRDYYTRRRPPFIDLDTQLPGDVAFDGTRLVSLIDDLLASGAAQTADHHRRARAFLLHRDRENCQRTYDAIVSARRHRG